MSGEDAKLDMLWHEPWKTDKSMNVLKTANLSFHNQLPGADIRSDIDILNAQLGLLEYNDKSYKTLK